MRMLGNVTQLVITERSRYATPTNLHVRQKREKMVIDLHLCVKENDLWREPKASTLPVTN